MSLTISSQRGPARSMLAIALLSAGMLAGCAQRDSISVGSIPDDYRTNHPIVIGEAERVIDLPVASSEYRLSRRYKSVLAGFMSDYDASSGAEVRIMLPYGSANAAAASRVASDMAGVIRAQGVPQDRIRIESYSVNAPDTAAPVRVAYTALKATVAPCGRWPDDLAKTADNKHYANFGCSYQNNLAAQIANPADLIGPRRTTEIDPENRGHAIDVYKQRGISDEFLSNSEVDY